MKFEIDGVVWEGPHRAWSESVALLDASADVVFGDDDAFMGAIKGFDARDVSAMVPLFRRLMRVAPGVVLQWIDGFTRDGVPVTDGSLGGTGWEPAIAAAFVAREHGFFTFSDGLQASALDLLPDLLTMAREANDPVPTQTTSDDETGGPAESGDGSVSPG